MSLDDLVPITDARLRYLLALAEADWTAFLFNFENGEIEAIISELLLRRAVAMARLSGLDEEETGR